MSPRSPGVFRRDFVLTIIVNFFIATVFYLLMTTMALHAVTNFNANDSVAGFTASAYVIGAVASRLFASKYLDFIGRRRTIIISLIASAGTSLLYLLATDITLLIVLRFVHGLSFGVASTAVSVAAVALVPVARRGEGMSYYSIAATLGIGVGPMLGTILIDQVGFDALFWASTAASTIGLFFALFLRVPERTPSDEERTALRRIRFSDMIDRDALPISTVVFLTCLAYSGVITFYLNYAESVGNAEIAALYFALYSVVVLFGRLVVGRLQDRFGDNTVYYPMLSLYVVGLVAISFPPATGVAITAAILLAIGYGAIMPATQTVAVSVARPERVGVATSTFFIMADAAIGVGPILIGVFLPLTGYQGMYLVLAGLMVGTIVAYHFLHGHKRADASSRVAV